MSGPIGNWDDIAEWWRREVADDPVYIEDVAPILRRLIGAPTGRVLELGCGDGQWLRWLGVQVRTAFGCDRSGDLLGGVVGSHPVVVCHLPSLAWLREGSIGTAFSVFVLDLIEDVDTFFAETERVVAAGGALAVIINHPVFTSPDSGPFMDPDLDVFWRWGNYLERGASDVPAGDQTVTMYHRSVGDVLAAAARAGWSLEDAIEAPLGAAAIEREPSYRGQEGIPRFLGVRWRH